MWYHTWLSISNLEVVGNWKRPWGTYVSNANIIKERKKLHRNFPRDWGSNQTSFRGSEAQCIDIFQNNPIGRASEQSHCLICPTDCVVRYLQLSFLVRFGGISCEFGGAMV